MSGATVERTEADAGQETIQQTQSALDVARQIARGVHVTLSTCSVSPRWITQDIAIPSEESDAIAEQRWAELLSDPEAIALFEEMAAEAAEEDAAGLTQDLSDLLR